LISKEKSMKKSLPILIVLFILLAVSASVAFAQTTPELQLGLSRDFGYGGFGNDIQGLFSLKINNPPEDLTKVEFYIDDTLIGDDTQAPYAIQFNTDSYPLGNHNLRAVGYTSAGATLNSNTIQANFVPAGAGMKSILTIVVPILVLVVVLILVSVFLPLVLNKGKLAQLPLGAERKYGIGGGAVCPKCGRPFPLRLWWINLGARKIDRCPFCGKWSMVRPVSLSVLRDAEQAELAQAQPEKPIVGETEAEKLHKEMDDSRFQDM
jgi:Bacterial Ig domain